MRQHKYSEFDRLLADVLKAEPTDRFSRLRKVAIALDARRAAADLIGPEPLDRALAFVTKLFAAGLLLSAIARLKRHPEPLTHLVDLIDQATAVEHSAQDDLGE